MAVDPFYNKPIRTHKGGGTRCTTCEIIDPCSDAGKCIMPLICVKLGAYGITDCDEPLFIAADLATGAIPYNCTLHAFDLTVQCDYELIDFTLSYETIYDVQYAVLRSELLNIETVLEFTDTANARCPTFDFGVLSVSPYAVVSIGQQVAIPRGPDDCTAGRCLPRFLCADIYTAEQPDDPIHTTLEWHLNDTIEINDVCCCNAHTFPEMLIARVVNYDAGCTCMAPQRIASMFWPQEHAGADLVDSGALLHMWHKIADSTDLWSTGYPFVTPGSNVWVSKGERKDLVRLCPSSRQTITPDTRQIYGRMILWCDKADGKFKAAFETIDFSAYGFDEDYAEIPFNLYSPFSTVTVMGDNDTDVEILTCSPFSVRCEGIFEDQNCQTLTSVDGIGKLAIVVSEFQGWVETQATPGLGTMTIYTERVDQAAPIQTIATDCWPKMHIRPTGELETFKHRNDIFYIDKPWPGPVWDSSTWLPNRNVDYQFLSRIEVYPMGCSGCQINPIEDPYLPPRVDCCEDVVPRVLFITAINQLDCPCADGTVIPLTYVSGTKTWVGGGTFGSGYDCGCQVDFVLACKKQTGASIWELTVRFNGVFFAFYRPGEPQDKIFSCSPFHWETKTLSNNSCCDPNFAASLFYWVITL